MRTLFLLLALSFSISSSAQSRAKGELLLSGQTSPNSADGKYVVKGNEISTIPGVDIAQFTGPTAPSGVMFKPATSDKSYIVEFPMSGTELMKVYNHDMNVVLTVYRDGSVSSDKKKDLDDAANYFWRAFADSFRKTLRQECHKPDAGFLSKSPVIIQGMSKDHREGAKKQ